MDEQFYFVAARAWIDGALPYAGLWDRKPIGLFLLYLPAAAAGYPAGIWIYQAMALACAVATAWTIAALARALGWGRGATLAAIAYLVWIVLAEGQGGQSPVFYNLPVALAAWLLRDAGPIRPARGVAAMALIGIALQIKYSVVFEGAWFGLWTLARHWRAHRRIGRTLGLAVLLAATAALPTLVAAGAYAATGHFGDWWFANIQSILLRHADPFAERAGNLAIVVLILSAPVAFALAGWRATGAAGAGAARAFAFGWLAFALAGLAAFGTWFDHYALPVLVPACLCAAGTLATRPGARRVAIGALLIAAIGGQALLVSKRTGRGTPAQFAALVRAVGRGPGCLYVYSGETMLYPASGRCRPSRYIFPSHLGRTRERGAIGVDQAAEVRHILAGRPEVIVMREPYRGERPEIRALVERAVARDYALRATLPLGRETVRAFSATRSR